MARLVIVGVSLMICVLIMTIDAILVCKVA